MFKRFKTDKEREIAEAKYYLEGEFLDKRLAEIESKDEIDLRKRLAKINLDRGHMSQHEYDKEIASIDDEPFVGCISSEYDPDQGVNGFYFELDWNDQFVKYLKTYGYRGRTEEEIVQAWFDDVCTTIAAEAEEPTVEDIQRMRPTTGHPFISRTVPEGDDTQTKYS